MPENRVVILFSGGLDSALLVAMAKTEGRRPLALSVAYGQRMIAETEYARRFCEVREVEYVPITMRLPVESALTGGQVHSLYRDVSEWYVPARNSIFLSLAASVAESRGIEEIWFGANADDVDHRFPDCTPEYISALNEMLVRGMSKRVFVRAPLLAYHKEDIKRRGAQVGIMPEEVFSGYGAEKQSA